MTVKSRLDLSGWDAALDKLAGEKRVSLARSMAVAGGEVLRDEAKRWAPVDDGILRDSIYLAFKDKRSNDKQVVYSVSWNHSVAPHGHLIEFGHWQPYVVVFNDKLGHFQTLAKGKGGGSRPRLRKNGPKWIAAKPFLRPAYDVARATAVQAMIARGKQRLPELLGEDSGD